MTAPAHTPTPCPMNLPWSVNQYGAVVGADGRQIEASGMAMTSGYRDPSDPAFDRMRLIVHRVNSFEGLAAALKEAINTIESLYRYEPIQAGESDPGEVTFKGHRYLMPEGLVEIANCAGIPPEDMNPKLARLKAALAAANQEP